MGNTFVYNLENNCPSSYDHSCYRNTTVELNFGNAPAIISLVSCSLSIIGSILTILPYVLWKDIRTGIRRIITLLAIADFFTAFGYILGSINKLTYTSKKRPTDDDCILFTNVCEIQSYISTWSSSSSFWWTAFLALNLYWVIVKGNTKKINRVFPIYHLIAWGSPILIVLPLLIAGNLGYSVFAAGGWCFIRGDKAVGHSAEQQYTLKLSTIFDILIGGKALEIATYVWVIVLYGLIFYKIRKQVNKESSSPGMSLLLKKVEKKIYFIPFAFILVRCWGTIQFLVSLVVFRDANGHFVDQNGCVEKSIFITYFVLEILQSLGDGAQGWANAILYVFWSPKIRKRLILNPLGHCCLYVAGYIGAPITTTRLPSTLSVVSYDKNRKIAGGNPMIQEEERPQIIIDDERNTGTAMGIFSNDLQETTPLIQSEQT
jgi:G protein-coupled receptor 157